MFLQRLLKQITANRRDIVTAFPLQLLTKTLETGNILQQETHMIHFEVTEHHS